MPIKTLCVSSAANLSLFSTSLSCSNTFFGSFCNDGADHDDCGDGDGYGDVGDDGGDVGYGDVGDGDGCGGG